MHALTRLGRAGNSFDSFVDLPSDYDNKQTKVKPNSLNRVLLLGAVLSDGWEVLKDVGLSKNLIKEFISSAKFAAENSSEKPK